MMPYTALSIAGFDSSGGAGIQADLKTFSALGCYGMTVLTALPIQNTCGVRKCYEIPLIAIEEQLEAIFDDIPPCAIKIGMLFNKEIIRIVASFLKERGKNIPLVIDPVTVAKSGDALLRPDAIEDLITELFPLATLITPNVPEAQTLTRLTLSQYDDMQEMAQALLKLGPQYVLLKGGHLEGDVSDDLLLGPEHLEKWYSSPRINSKNTHGTGCTLSAAITALLAQGKSMEEACALAKTYLFEAIKAAKTHSVGQGHGPVHHFYHLWPVTL